MPALRKTEYTARIIWLGHVKSRAASLRSEPLEEMPLSFAGFDGEDHAGLTRPSDVRVKDLYERDTEIRNTRQISLVSAEELAEIAAEMGIEAVDPTWLGASVVVEGLPDFTRLPPSSRLQAENGTTITVDMENRPCIWPGKEVEKEREGFGKLFKPAAKNRRGVTAWVEREGTLKLGAELRLFVPDQRAWAP